MNELLTPFLCVILSEYCELDFEKFGVPEGFEKIKETDMKNLEADSYWCFSKLMEKILDNYTPENPGIKKSLNKMKQVTSVSIDESRFSCLEFKRYLSNYNFYLHLGFYFSKKNQC